MSPFKPASLKLAGCAAALLLAASLPTAPATAAEATLKAVSAFAQGTNFSKQFERFIELVNEQGKGVVRIDYVGGGGKVMNPFELGNAIRTGVVHIGNLPGAFYTNIMPEADALKMTDRNVTELRAAGAYAAVEALHNQKANAHLIGRHKSKVPFHLYLNKPITGRDLNGLKIRVTPIYRAFFASMGASLIRTAPGEVFTALERGVVDGYGWPIQGIFDLGWHEVTKYRVDPGFYSAAVEILVNQEQWQKLTDAQKKVLTAAAEQMEREGDAADLALNQSETQRQAKQGIQTIAFTGAEGQTYLRDAQTTAWEAIVQANPETGPKLQGLLGK